MRKVPLGSILDGTEESAVAFCPHQRFGQRNFITLACPGHPIRSGKVRFGFISVFLVNVLVERQRNEIERTSARLRTFDCHKRNFNHVRLHFDLS